MKIDLPLENWVDFFEFLSRKQLAALLPHIGDEQEETKNRPIADRQFVAKAQFYLHKCGEVTLGQFSIKSSLAELPSMPSNIKSFKEITVNYYDQSVLDFLQEFHRNSLFTNVNLILGCGNRRKFDAMSQMMTQLLPSITSIESLTSDDLCCDFDCNTALFQEHADMLAEFRFGDADWYWCRHWLHIPREDGRPRVLVANCSIHPINPFIENSKKDFLDANQAVSFFACVWTRDDAACRHVQSISLDNDKTQEKLVIKGKGSDPDLRGFVTISRYPMGAKEEWIKEMRKGMEDGVEERSIIVDLTCEV